MNTNEITIESLSASEYFQQYCLNPTAANMQYWHQWLEANKDHTATFKTAKELVLQLSLQPTEAEIGEEWEQLKKQMSTKQEVTPKQRFFENRMLWGIAATVLVFLMAFGLWKSLEPLHTLQPITIATAYGQTQKLLLPDSSEVMLNANSKLTYNKDWSKSRKRDVWLEGEAYFEVVHNQQSPFAVHTNKGVIHVLGTSFNVSQRSENFNVTLVKGKVVLSLPNQPNPINLQAGEQIIVVKDEVQQIEADVDLITAWQSGKLIFKNATIQSIIHRLQNEYGWTISVKNDVLLERKVNATILKNKPELLLEALTEIYELDIRKVSEGVYEIR
ncbi:MAG: FecR domain-containing protein [Chitinophagales bacterium]